MSSVSKVSRPGFGMGEPWPTASRTGGVFAPGSTDRSALGFKGASRSRGLQVSLHRIAGVTKEGVLDAPFYFQVPPMESFSKEVNHSHSDYDTLRAGQFSRSGGPQLRTVTFQTMFIDYNPQWANWPDRGDRGQVAPPARRQNYGLADFDQAERDEIFNVVLITRTLELLVKTGTPFRLRAWSPSLWQRYDSNMPATLRSLRIEEKAGEIDARYVDVSFTEWRRLAIPRKQFGKKRKTGGTGESGRGASERTPTKVDVWPDGSGRDITTHEHIFRGDADPFVRRASASRLCQHYYGEPTLYPILYRANPILRGLPPRANIGDLVTSKNGGRVLRLTIPRLTNDLIAYSNDFDAANYNGGDWRQPSWATPQ